MKNLLLCTIATTFALSVFAQGESTPADETKKEVAVEERPQEKKIDSTDRPRSLLSFGTDGFGWSGLGSTSKIDRDKTNIDDLTTSEGALNLNYHYIFASGIMLGPEISFGYSSTEKEFQNGEKLTEETRTTTIGVSLGFNFNQDLYNSWWIKGVLGGGSTWAQTKDTTATPEKTETDSNFGFASLEGGKRFSFKAWGIKNFSYSPSIVLGSASFGGDAEDAGLETTSFAQINILKFDLLF